MRKHDRLGLIMFGVILLGALALAGCGGGGSSSGGGSGGGFSVTSTIPANGAVVDPATLTEFSVSFSATLDTNAGGPPTVTETVGMSSTDISSIFDTRGTWSDDGRTGTVPVDYFFKEGATYTITFPASNFRDVNGKSLAADK